MLIYSKGRLWKMKHFYSEIDNITLTFGDVHENAAGLEYIPLYFEKPIENGFAFCEMNLPVLNPYKSFGFSEMDINELVKYARNNAPLIWEIAREKM